MTVLPLRARLHPSGSPKRILSLDGGGIRGIITLAFLERIEHLLRERTGDPGHLLCDHFDLIGGTSTGAIIAAGLSLGHPVSHLIELYLGLSRQGFQRRWWFGGTLVPKFRTAALEAAIAAQVGTTTLGSDKLRTGLAIVAKRLDTGSAWVFHNNPAGRFFTPVAPDAAASPNRDLPLAQLIRASTAAPSYFAPQMIEVAQGVSGAFVDGAASPHNNPALLLLMLATLRGYGFRWPMGLDRLTLVSVGTGGTNLDPAVRAVSRMPSAWLAVTSLQSLMRDCDWLAQTMLQWISESPAPWVIDGEVGTLAEDTLGPAKLLRYLRYDAPLEAGWLASEAGLVLPAAELRALHEFDKPALAPRLLEIGRIVAERCVRPEHW